MRLKLGLGITILLAMLAIAGCTKPLIKNKSPLAPARMSPDSCVLDVFFVRIPFGDTQANEELWQELDEQHFPADVRQRLTRNGFRAGIAAGQIPIALSTMLELDDKPAPVDEIKGTNTTDLGVKPKVIRQHMQLRAGHRGEIIASGTYEQLPVLMCDSEHLSGETYNQAQGIFGIKTTPLSDGRVRIDMTPEIHHGQARQRYITDQGMMRFDFNRPKRVFDDLALSGTLSPGGMIIMTSLPNKPGSLGHHFLTENNGRLEQKILVVRLSQTQHDGLFDTPDVLPLEEKTE